MEYKTVSEMVKIWNIPERSLRNYCESGKIQGVIRDGRRWLIPENAQAPVKFGTNDNQNLKVEKAVNSKNISDKDVKEKKGDKSVSKEVNAQAKAKPENKPEKKVVINAPKEKAIKEEKKVSVKPAASSLNNKKELEYGSEGSELSFANIDKVLCYEKELGITKGFYGDLITFFIYNANKANGNKLSVEDIETLIFDFDDRLVKKSVRILEFLDTINLAECFNLTLDNIKTKLSLKLLLTYESILNKGKQSLIVEQNRPKSKDNELNKIIEKFSKKDKHTIEDLAELHYYFVTLNYFGDNNDKIARLILLKESLASDMTPVVMSEKLNYFYNRGMVEFARQPMFLRETFKNYQETIIKMMVRYNFKRK